VRVPAAAAAAAAGFARHQPGAGRCCQQVSGEALLLLLLLLALLPIADERGHHGYKTLHRMLISYSLVAASAAGGVTPGARHQQGAGRCCQQVSDWL
jgi:hypothetical protein